MNNNEGIEIKLKTLKIEEIRIYSSVNADLSIQNFLNRLNREDLISVSFQQKRNIYFNEAKNKDVEVVDNYLVIVYMG